MDGNVKLTLSYPSRRLGTAQHDGKVLCCPRDNPNPHAFSRKARQMQAL